MSGEDGYELGALPPGAEEQLAQYREAIATQRCLARIRPADHSQRSCRMRCPGLLGVAVPISGIRPAYLVVGAPTGGGGYLRFGGRTQHLDERASDPLAQAGSNRWMIVARNGPLRWWASSIFLRLLQTHQDVRPRR